MREALLRALVTEAFAAQSDGTGYTTSIFAEDVMWEIVDHSATSRKYVIVLWDGSGITRVGTRYENTYDELWETVSPATQ